MNLRSLLVASSACLACLSTATTTSPSPSFRTRLLSGPLALGSPATFELAAAHRALNLFKDALGPEAITTLLTPAINTSNEAWHAILSRSGSGGGPILSEARLRAYDTAYNASGFLAWFGADTGDKHKMTGAHPEHYVEALGPGSGGAGSAPSVDILEAWGPLVTRYRIPAYALGGPKKAFMKPLRRFPFQFTGQAVLRDGTTAVVGDIHNSFRDLEAGEEVGAGQKGVEAVLAVWLPAGTPNDVVEGLREHQAVEFSNWLAFAQRDFETGVFSV